MACGSCGGKRVEPAEEETVYVVTHADGRTEEVTGLHRAKVASTMSPGAVYRRR